MIKLTLLTSAIIIVGLTANTVNAAYVMTDKERESQLAHAYIEGNPTTKVQKQISALTNGKEITGTIYKSDGSVDIKRTAQMLVKTNGKDPLVEAEKRAAAQAAAAVELVRLNEIARLNRIQVLTVTIGQLTADYFVLSGQSRTATDLVSGIELAITGIDERIATANNSIRLLQAQINEATASLNNGGTASQMEEYQDTIDHSGDWINENTNNLNTANAERTTQNDLLDAAKSTKAGLDASMRDNCDDYDRAYESLRNNGGYITYVG